MLSCVVVCCRMLSCVVVCCHVLVDVLTIKREVAPPPLIHVNVRVHVYTSGIIVNKSNEIFNALMLFVGLWPYGSGLNAINGEWLRLGMDGL